MRLSLVQIQCLHNNPRQTTLNVWLRAINTQTKQQNKHAHVLTTSTFQKHFPQMINAVICLAAFVDGTPNVLGILVGRGGGFPM